jgi:hypothetical protein
MRVILFTLALLALLVPASGAQDTPKPPEGIAPKFGIALATLKDGTVIIDISELREVMRMKLEGRGDVFIEKRHWLPLTAGVLGKDIRAYRPDGKIADAKDVLKALAKPSGVVYFLGRDKTKPMQPDPLYLSLLKEGSVALAFELPPVIPGNDVQP